MNQETEVLEQCLANNKKIKKEKKKKTHDS